MFGPAWHCLTQFDVQADSVLQMVLDLGRYLDNHPIPDHEDIVNIIKDIVGTIVTSVNGKTGEVNLKLSDVTGTDSWPIWILTYAEYGELTDATMLDAYDNDGFRLLYVTAGGDPENEPAFLMIPGRTFNPDGITRYIFTGGGGSGGGAVQSVNGKVGTVVLTADDVGALPDTYVPPAPPVTSVNTKTGEVVLSASDVGAATPADVSAVEEKVDAKYGPDNAPPYPVTGGIDEAGTSLYFVRGSNNVGIAADGAGNLLGINSSGAAVTMYSPVNPPPYPVTGRVDSAGSASFFVKDSGNVGLAADGAGNVFGINTAGTGVKMYSPINPPPASPIPFYYARSNASLSVASTDTAVPFNDTVYAGAGITHANATFTIPAGSYAISIIINGALNTSSSTQVTLKTVNVSSTLYYVQSYFSATPSNQFVLSWPMQLYYFASTATFRVVARIDSGGSIGTYNPYTISIIKLA